MPLGTIAMAVLSCCRGPHSPERIDAIRACLRLYNNAVLSQTSSNLRGRVESKRYQNIFHLPGVKETL